MRKMKETIMMRMKMKRRITTSQMIGRRKKRGFM
jgi:hypothetical protein